MLADILLHELIHILQDDQNIFTNYNPRQKNISEKWMH